MRIGFDAKRVFSNLSGLGNYSRNTLALLTTYYPDNEYILFTPRPSDLFDYAAYPNIHIVQPKSFLHKKFRSYWRTYSLSRSLLKENLSLYHGLSHELPFGIHKTRQKTVVTIHDLIFLRFPELYKKIDRKIYHKKFAYSCHAATRIIAISEQTKQDIIEYFQVGPEKIDVVYQGCHPNYYLETPETTKQMLREKYHLPDPYILYVGTVEKRKNVLSAIKALHVGKITIPMVVVGKHTPYINEIKEYIKHHKVKHIHFLDHVHWNDLPGIYQMAELFIYPSIFEGFGIPILEALNSKVPVITSKNGCFPEAGGPDSYYIDPQQPEEIAHAIHTILTDHSLREKMISSGLEHAGLFREPLVAKRLMESYKKVWA